MRADLALDEARRAAVGFSRNLARHNVRFGFAPLGPFAGSSAMSQIVAMVCVGIVVELLLTVDVLVHSKRK